jgi:hypothetical protein
MHARSVVYESILSALADQRLTSGDEKDPDALFSPNSITWLFLLMCTWMHIFTQEALRTRLEEARANRLVFLISFRGYAHYLLISKSRPC